MCAAFGNHGECVTLLLAAGADPSVTMTAHNGIFDAGPGTTALDLAKKNGHQATVALLEGKKTAHGDGGKKNARSGHENLEAAKAAEAAAKKAAAKKAAEDKRPPPAATMTGLNWSGESTQPGKCQHTDEKGWVGMTQEGRGGYNCETKNANTKHEKCVCTCPQSKKCLSPN